MLKISQDEKYVSIKKASLMLDISDTTIKRWYKWWESPEFEKPEGLELPKYYYKDRRMTKYFKVEDIEKLAEFSRKIGSTHVGTMAKFNAVYQWGKRGEKILKNAGTTKEEVRGKMR